MGRIKGITEFVETTATTTITPPLPEHVSGDTILVFVVADNVATAFATTGSSAGWTIGGQNQSAGTTTAACRAGWFWIVADTAAESLVVVSSSTTFTVTAIVIEGAHATTPIDVSNGNGILISANPGTATAFQAASVTTVNANALVFWTMFNSLSTPSPFPGVRTVSAHDTGAIGLGIGMLPQVATGASGTLDFYTEDHTSTSQNSVSFTVAIRDAATAVYQPAYLNKAHAEMLSPFRGIAASVRGEVNNTTNTNVYTNFAAQGQMQSKAVFQYDDSATTFTDVTTAANNATTADLTLLNATPAANDYIALCMDSPFPSISLLCSTTGVAGVFLAEVLNGSTWTSLDTVSTSLICWKYWVTTTLTNKTDTSFVVGTVTSLYLTPAALRKIAGLWKVSTLNSVSGYWMRLRYTTAPTTNPTLSWIRPSMGIGTYDASATVVDAGANPFHNSCSITPAIRSTTVSGPPGTYRTLGTDISGYTPANKLLIGTHTFALARDYVDLGARSELSGYGVYFADSSFNSRLYTVAAYQANDTDQSARNVFAIQWSAAAVTYTLGPTNPTTLTYVGQAADHIRGTGSIAQNQLVSYGVPILSGGIAATPITNDEFLKTFAIDYYYPIPLIRNNVAILPIQIGGGDVVFCQLDTLLLSFARLTTEPQAFSTAPYCAIHADNNYLGFVFDARAGDVMKLTNSVISSDSSWRFEVTATASASATWSFSGSKFINASVTLRAVYTWDNISWQDCSSFVTNAAVITNNTFVNTKVTVTSPANAANISLSSFTSGGTGHAIEIGGTAANCTLSGLTFSGYSGTSTNAAIYVNIATGTMTISITNGGDTPTIRTAGATVTVVNARTVRVTAKDADDAAVIQNARVLLYATTGTSVTITRVSTTASVAHTAHGYANGQKAAILGANEGEYNGIKTISNVSTNAYDYTVSGTPATPATGTILSHRVILDALTNASGIVEDTAFPYVSDLGVTGRVRKGTSATYYKTASVSGTITSAAGFDTTAFMSKDT